MASGAETDLIGRADTVAALRREGLRRSGIFGEASAPAGSFAAYGALSELPGRAYDYALVCTKSFDTAVAAEDLAGCAGLLGEAGRLVLCQNGWGNAEVATAWFPRQRIRNARVITGFRRPTPATVEITVHAEAVRIGSLFDPATADVQPLCEAIQRGGIPCEATASVGKDLWAKMLYNGALNPLGAVLRVPYGLLGESGHTRFLMQAIVKEIFAVMRSAGFSTHWDSPEAYWQVFYEGHLPSTYRHESSMLQDLRAGKRTEIDALNGAVVRMGEGLKIETPYNRSVCALIRFLESGVAGAAHGIGLKDD
jgi:2-dehydropantoate 2-reductase